MKKAVPAKPAALAGAPKAVAATPVKPAAAAPAASAKPAAAAPAASAKPAAAALAASAKPAAAAPAKAPAAAKPATAPTKAPSSAPSPTARPAAPRAAAKPAAPAAAGKAAASAPASTAAAVAAAAAVEAAAAAAAAAEQAAAAAAAAAEAARLAGTGTITVAYAESRLQFPIAAGRITAEALDEELALTFAYPSCQIHLTRAPVRGVDWRTVDWAKLEARSEDGTFSGLLKDTLYYAVVVEDGAEKAKYEEQQRQRAALFAQRSAATAAVRLEAEDAHVSRERCSCVEGNPVRVALRPCFCHPRTFFSFCSSCSRSPLPLLPATCPRPPLCAVRHARELPGLFQQV